VLPWVFTSPPHPNSASPPLHPSTPKPNTPNLNPQTPTPNPQTPNPNQDVTNHGHDLIAAEQPRWEVVRWLSNWCAGAWRCLLCIQHSVTLCNVCALFKHECKLHTQPQTNLKNQPPPHPNANSKRQNHP